LIEKKETEISRYVEIKNNILPENIEAVQKEQINIYRENLPKIIRQLNEIYKQKYSYKIFKEVENTVNSAVGEKPVSVKILLQQKQQEISKINQKNKNFKYER